MQGRVRLKLNTSNIFTNMREKPLLIFLAYTLTILLAYLPYKSSMTQTYVSQFFSTSQIITHIIFKNLGKNKKQTRNEIRISLLSLLATYKLYIIASYYTLKRFSQHRFIHILE